MNQIFGIHGYSYTINDRTLFKTGDLSIHTGDIIHFHGPSGSGKSLFGLGLIGFFSSNANVEYDFSIDVEKQHDWKNVRSNYVGYIFQQPRAYFNPVKTIGVQLMELIEGDKDAKAKIIHAWVDRLKINRDQDLLSRYPHQFSIGELQRIYVISAFIRSPKLIIADEPFAHVDWPTAKIIADELTRYVRETHSALLLISHEPPGLLCDPTQIWNLSEGTIRKTEIEGQNRVTSNLNRIKTSSTSSVISLLNVSKDYKNNSLLSQSNKIKHALKNISLEIKQGERIGVMGDSGSGKTTLAKLMTGMIAPSDGELFNQTSITFSLSTLFNRKPSAVQLVFQDPFESFNRSQILRDQIITNSNRHIVTELMQKMGVDDDRLDRASFALSGGELQRLAIIRALSVTPKPRLLIMDEALSALDTNNQQIVLSTFQEEFPDLAIMYISHRFHRLKALCDRIIFLDKGSISYEHDSSKSDWSQAPDRVRALVQVSEG